MIGEPIHEIIKSQNLTTRNSNTHYAGSPVWGGGGMFEYLEEEYVVFGIYLNGEKNLDQQLSCL